MKRSKFTQVMAIIGIVLLVGMYITSLIFALIKNPIAKKFFMVSITGTFVIPVIIYILMMFYKLMHKNDPIPEEKIYADDKDDMFTDEEAKEINESNSITK